MRHSAGFTRSALRRHAHHPHRWPLLLLVAALLLLAACDPKKGNPLPKPETAVAVAATR
jgi:hypothetical protein